MAIPEEFAEMFGRRERGQLVPANTAKVETRLEAKQPGGKKEIFFTTNEGEGDETSVQERENRDFLMPQEVRGAKPDPVTGRQVRQVKRG